MQTPFNLPFIGQKFSGNYGIFKPDQNGGSQLVRYLDPRRVGVMSGRQFQTMWILPNGHLSIYSLKPMSKYRLAGDKLTYHAVGDISITGVFPYFEIFGTGQRVWMTANRDFKFTPCDYVDDCVDARRFAHNLRRRLTNVATANMVIVPRRAGYYNWTLVVDSRKIAMGREMTEQACRDLQPYWETKYKTVNIRVDWSTYNLEMRQVSGVSKPT